MSSPDWHDVAALDDVWPDAGLAVTAAGQELALFRVGDEVFVTEAMCTHGQARLCEGYVEGAEVECPLHQARFDLRTGIPSCGPATAPVKVFATRVQAGRVEVAI